MKGLIIASGNITDYTRLVSIIKYSDFVLCADGGMDHLLKINYIPDLVLGDFDSISKDSFNFIRENNIPIQKYPSIKDSTDTELAIDYLVENGFDEIILTGVTGTRLDHTMANVLLLNYLLKKRIKGKIIDDHNTIYLLEDYKELNDLKDFYISLIPINEDGIVLSLSGFFYNLDHEFIEFGSSRGISNKIIGQQGIIQIHNGKALLFISKD